MSRISVRGFAVASATAVTTVGAVVGVASGNPQSSDNVETAASDATTLLADVPSGEQAQVQAVALAEQAGAQAAAAETTAKKSAEESARIAAAKAAKDKKAAAEAKAKKEREEAKERAERSKARDASSFTAKASYSIAEVKDIARQMMSAGDFQCFSNIVTKESGWRYTATNPSSGAYGLVQAYPATKMATAGADWRTNPATQIKWGLSYMKERYDSPCGAWSFWQKKRWY
ncbi:aggregation-promoting factor C-terminal-like domain-containing protein [Streptomyces tsukubensis]|uniref:aggregation-promoting factor C-terminal-like domain-containing protein n=1 Tax=Streptomyces tsukubensis TaxID=83656 RepID=UPI0036C71BAA